MFELLKKIIALVPVGHELYNAIAELLKELCGRVEASDTSVRETREMLLARADQLGELTTRLAQIESTDRIPQLANEIKDVRIDGIESALAAMVKENATLATRLEALDRYPDVRFQRVELSAPAAADNDGAEQPSELAAAPAAAPVQCAFHPYAPMNGSQCLFPECSWPGIDAAA